MEPDSSFLELAKESTHRYNVNEYRFAQPVLQWFSLHEDCLPLEKMHEGRWGRRLRDHEAAKGTGDSSSRSLIHKHWKSAPPEILCAFDAEFRRFIVEVVAPLMGGPVYYEHRPAFRFHLPVFDHKRPLMQPHCDADYHHQSHEINFWIPLSNNIGDCNSLFVESEPGKGDYRPFNDVPYGTFKKFYGNKCRHYTVQNRSEWTRCSFDFRVVRKCDYRHDAPESMNKEGKNRFKVGEFYRSSEVDEAVIDEGEIERSGLGGVGEGGE